MVKTPALALALFALPLAAGAGDDKADTDKARQQNIDVKTPALALALFALPLAAGAGDDKADTDKARQQIIDLTNKHRASETVPAVKLNATLMAVAQKHAENMARQEKMSHLLDGKTSKERAQEAGYPGVVGENVSMSVRPAAGEAAETAISVWLKSPPHRANIFQKAYTEIGSGMARSKSGRWYLCQVFGLPGKAGGKIFARLVNRAGETIRVEVNKGSEPLEIADRSGFGVPVSLPKEGLTVRLLPADSAGAAIPITLRNGDNFVITKDGKGYKVQKGP
jgi:uncharacterized protein YkwD